MSLLPLAVVLPLIAAALLLALEKVLPEWLPDVFAAAVAAAVAVLCLLVARQAWDGPVVHWFGGWQPRGGKALGIAFAADAAGASVAAFTALLFTGAILFAWGFFGDEGARFHVLVLVLLAAMVGFCLTGDLFNLFVFFELMSVAAFALTAYKLEASSIEGALNFTVVNTIGSFLMLSGIGLLYGRTEALNLAEIGQRLASREPDALVAMALVLVLSALLIKAAVVPFHFWLPDAHAVAPTPVCVILSGVMVSVPLFGAARLVWTVFAPLDRVAPSFDALLLALGVGSALLGGVACLIQTNIKRLLAFSTVSHLGIMLVGLATLNGQGLGGMLLYLAGHGLAKGALFMLAGILMSRCQAIDERRLHGRARPLRLTGAAFAAGALLLAGLPLGGLHAGHEMIATAVRPLHPWVPLALTLGSVLTGAAALRVAARVFLGLGPRPAAPADAPPKPEHEKPGRPVWLMLAPALAFLGLSAALQGHEVSSVALHHAGGVMDHQGYARTVLEGATPLPVPAIPTLPEAPSGPWRAWWPVLLALGIAALQLWHRALPAALARPMGTALGPVLRTLDRLHNGRIGDYVAWMTAGLALLGIACVLP